MRRMEVVTEETNASVVVASQDAGRRHLIKLQWLELDGWTLDEGSTVYDVQPGFVRVTSWMFMRGR